jgi:serine/threonine protein kinase
MKQSLREYLRKNRIGEETALLLIYQLLKGVQHIHQNNYIHCDLKPLNCLINSKTFELKICDFGCTIPKERDLNEPTHGTRWYRAPEWMNSESNPDFKADMWAVGCIFFELFHGRPLFPGENTPDQFSLIQNFFGTISQEKKGIARLQCQKVKTLIPNVNENICNFIQKLISFNSNERPNVS